MEQSTVKKERGGVVLESRIAFIVLSGLHFVWNGADCSMLIKFCVLFLSLFDNFLGYEGGQSCPM